LTETGRILWFGAKGYGFILRDGLRMEDVNSQIYVHISAFNVANLNSRNIHPKQKVEYEIIPGKKNGTLEAMNVRLIT
jgi:cold shock CspA family protein